MQGTGQQTVPSGQQQGGPGSNKPAPPVKPTVPPELQAERIETLEPAKLIAILKDPASSIFQKTVASKRMAVVGTKEAVLALAGLLADPQIAHYARFGLEPIPDPSVDDVLREALKKLKGRLLVGVIASIGVRRDVKAIESLSKLIYDANNEVAQAAATALGNIGGPQVARTIKNGLSRTKSDVRTAVAAAGLLCAEGLMAKGEREQAFELYNALSRRDIPKTVRLAAMQSMLAAETSLGRPR